MEISIVEADGKLDELIRRVESGEAIILTREGRPAAQLSPIKTRLSTEEKRRRIAAFRATMRTKADSEDANAARSQDFLYDEFGLPK